jgi:hypothetical protein
VSIRNKNVGSKFGFLSIILSAVPLAALLMPGFPEGEVIGHVVTGAWGASVLFAVVAGVIGSRWWFLSLLGPGIVAALLRFSP